MNNKDKKTHFLNNCASIKKNNPYLKSYEVEKIAEQITCTNLLSETKDIKEWVKDAKNSFKSNIKEIPINNAAEWKTNNKGNLVHKSGKFFSIVGIRIGENSDREVGKRGWDQPIVKEFNYDGGLLGLIRTKIDDMPHYLIQARFEPGNYGLIQLGPTLQATFSNFNKVHGGREPYYSDFFKDYKIKKNYAFNSWLAEDGGKFLKKRNLGLVKNIPFDEIEIINKNYKFVSLYQISKMMKLNSIINPHLSRLIFV